MDKNILLIGGAGFIGSNLVKKFIQDTTYNLFVLEPESANIKKLIGYEITLIRGDLKNLVFVNKILECYKINIIFHLVSTLLPDSTLEDYQNEMNNLLLPSMGLMKLCSEKKIKLIYFSSGGTIYGNCNEYNKKETDELAPISYYGLSKCVMEEAIHFENRRSGMTFVILRPSNPYGHGQNMFGRQGIIAVALGKYLGKEKMVIWGNGEFVRDYIYIDDLVCCVYQIIERNVENEVINIGSGTGHSINNIIRIINDNIPFPIEIEYKQQRSVDVKSVVLNIEKLKSIINFKPTYIQQGIQTFIRELGITNN